jgi:toxin FitB
MSVLVIGEIRRGVERLRMRDPDRSSRFESWLNDLLSVFNDRIIPVDVEVAQTWGRWDAVRTLPVVDGLMAATAVVKGLTFVTRNTRDFAGLDIRLFDPWRV